MTSPAPAEQPRPSSVDAGAGGAFAAPYRVPSAPALPEPPAARTPSRSRALGLVALVVAVVALAGSVVIGAVAVMQVAATATITGELDAAGLRALAPARSWVLVGEIAFWTGTALGLWALIQGVIAIALGRGRALGVAAVATAVAAPVLFGSVILALVLLVAA